MLNDNPENVATAKNAATDQAVISSFAHEALKEQRAARRWSTVFKSFFVVYILVLTIASWPALWSGWSIGDDKVTALVDLQGIIAHGTDASADAIVTGLREAFEYEKTAGVILRINSPGGSPVQSGYINDEIYRLKEKYPDIPIYAVIEDICASGGYYVAVAADEIYADKGSIVGSIGVRMDGFGFVDAIEKIGVERRLLTAGEHKGSLDPFLPLQATDMEHYTKVLNEVHQQFINTVLKGRRDRLTDEAALFSGFVWTGEKSLELGLIDGLGSSGYVAREIIGAKEIVNFTVRGDYIERLARRFGAQVVESLVRMVPQLR